MPFINDHKLLFVHIPKTGGSSIESKFRINSRNELFTNTENIIDGTLYSDQHLIPSIIKSKYPKKFEEYKKFCIIRNPYTKIISEYFWCKKVNRVKDKTIDEFIKTLNPFTRDHLLPQYSYFEDIEYNYVLSTESLNEDFANMAKDFSFDSSLPHSNRSLKDTDSKDLESYLKHINEESIEIINRLYEKDFELFNYEMVKT